MFTNYFYKIDEKGNEMIYNENRKNICSILKQGGEKLWDCYICQDKT